MATEPLSGIDSPIFGEPTVAEPVAEGRFDFVEPASGAPNW